MIWGELVTSRGTIPHTLFCVGVGGWGALPALSDCLCHRFYSNESAVDKMSLEDEIKRCHGLSAEAAARSQRAAVSTSYLHSHWSFICNLAFKLLSILKVLPKTYNLLGRAT